jgi:colanic acid/amylovoran biosynthesis glycosyltransferase
VKICYIVKSYPRLSQTFILHELLELERQGVDLAVVALKAATDEPIHPLYETLRAPVHYLPSPAPNRATDDHAAVVARLMECWGIEHLHAHFATWAASLAMRVSDDTGIPFSFTAHARDIFHERVQPGELADKVARARFAITVSEYNKRYLDALLHGEGKSGRVIRLYNGVALQTMHSSGDEREADLIVGVGRLVPKKGFAYLVEACRILREGGRRVRCVIAGDGEERAALAQQIARHGLEDAVALLGARPQAEVIALIRRAAAFALPCVVGPDGDRDGLPTVLLEAMALGTPAISTPVAGIPEMIEHGRTGLLVNERDAAALADAIATILDSRALQHDLRAAAIRKVRRDFDLADNVRTLRGYFLADRVPA